MRLKLPPSWYSFMLILQMQESRERITRQEREMQVRESSSLQGTDSSQLLGLAIEDGTESGERDGLDRRAASASSVAMTAWSTNALRSRSMPRRRSASSELSPARLLAQRLEPDQGVAEVVAAHGGEPGLGHHHRASSWARPAT